MFFFFYCSGDHRDLHSFPTRRSSDLSPLPEIARVLVRFGHVASFIVNANDGVVDRKSTRLNSSHRCISYAVFCLKKKKSTTRRECNFINPKRQIATNGYYTRLAENSL